MSTRLLVRYPMEGGSSSEAGNWNVGGVERRKESRDSVLSMLWMKCLWTFHWRCRLSR